jgi:hypothetical protein
MQGGSEVMSRWFRRYSMNLKVKDVLEMGFRRGSNCGDRYGGKTTMSLRRRSRREREVLSKEWKYI